MLQPNIPHRQSLKAAKLTQIERMESDREIRETLAASSARFVTSRLLHFQTERGLNLSRNGGAL